METETSSLVAAPSRLNSAASDSENSESEELQGSTPKNIFIAIYLAAISAIAACESINSVTEAIYKSCEASHTAYYTADLDPALVGLDSTLVGLDSTLVGLDPVLSDSDSESENSDSNSESANSNSNDVLKPGDIRVTVKQNELDKSIIIKSSYFEGVCRLPLEETGPDKNYKCALTSAKKVFAGTFETCDDLVAAVIAFAETAASGSKTSTASIKRLLM